MAKVGDLSAKMARSYWHNLAVQNLTNFWMPSYCLSSHWVTSDMLVRSHTCIWINGSINQEVGVFSTEQRNYWNQFEFALWFLRDQVCFFKPTGSNFLTTLLLWYSAYLWPYVYFFFSKIKIIPLVVLFLITCYIDKKDLESNTVTEVSFSCFA